MEFDRDLQSLQEVRNLVARAKTAQEEYAGYSQEKMDEIIRSVAEACAGQGERLARMAAEETGFGIWQDKVLKNKLGSTMTYESIRTLRCVGVLREDEEQGLWEIGVPVGVCGCIDSLHPILRPR